MRQMYLVVDSEAATYVGPEIEYQGYDGKITRKTDSGVWFTLKDTFVDGERVNTLWAYEYQESVLPRVLTSLKGRDMHAYHAPFVSLFIPSERVHYPGNGNRLNQSHEKEWERCDI